MEKYIPLRTTFDRRGPFKEVSKNGGAYGKRIRILHEQIKYEPGYGYIYKVTFDEQIFYQVFKELFYENENGTIICNYPNDDDFLNGNAFNANSVEEAEEILFNLESCCDKWYDVISAIYSSHPTL